MMGEIYNVLAANKFEEHYNQQSNSTTMSELDKIKNYLESAKRYCKGVSEYSWLIEG